MPLSSSAVAKKNYQVLIDRYDDVHFCFWLLDGSQLVLLNKIQSKRGH